MNFLSILVQFSCSVVSDSLWPHGLQHARPPCPSPIPRACSNSCPSSQWCHPTISSSVIPFSSHLQSFPAPGSFPMCHFFASGGHSIGVSTSASILPMNIQGWFPLGLTSWISLQHKGLLRVFSNTTVQKHPFFSSQLSLSEKVMATHSSTLAWQIPWMEEPCRLQSIGLLRVGHDWVTSLSLFIFMHWKRKWQPTPVFLPGESQGRGILVGCRLWGRTESDTTEVT